MSTDVNRFIDTIQKHENSQKQNLKITDIIK